MTEKDPLQFLDVLERKGRWKTRLESAMAMLAFIPSAHGMPINEALAYYHRIHEPDRLPHD